VECKIYKVIVAYTQDGEPVLSDLDVKKAVLDSARKYEIPVLYVKVEMS
jgi:hypothetical protein